jgi:DNA-binding CsgD family transcriptional regulator
MKRRPIDPDGKSMTVLDQAREFFKRNPDEVLTNADIQTKYNCSDTTARNVCASLIREGISSEQLPHVPRARHVKALPFPQSLTAAERRAIEAVALCGDIAQAAANTNLSRGTLYTHLNLGRRKAGVNSTKALVERFREATAA